MEVMGEHASRFNAFFFGKWVPRFLECYADDCVEDGLPINTDWLVEAMYRIKKEYRKKYVALYGLIE